MEDILREQLNMVNQAVMFMRPPLTSLHKKKHDNNSNHEDNGPTKNSIHKTIFLDKSNNIILCLQTKLLCYERGKETATTK